MFGDKASLDSETLLSDLLSAFITELFHLALKPLALEELEHLVHALLIGQGPYVVLQVVGTSVVSGIIITFFLDQI